MSNRPSGLAHKLTRRLNWIDFEYRFSSVCHMCSQLLQKRQLPCLCLCFTRFCHSFLHPFCWSFVPDTGWPPILSLGTVCPTCHMTSSPCTSAITIVSGSKVTRTIRATPFEPSTHSWGKSSCWSSITLHCSPFCFRWLWWEDAY